MLLCMSRLAPLISTSPSRTISHAGISKSKSKYLASFQGFNIRGLQYQPKLMIARRNFAVCSNITPPPGVPLPSGSMKSWVLGIVLTFVLPFITHKWGPLIALKNKVDTAVNMAENIVEVIEDVAGKVDKVIDNITDDLPVDSKLRKELEAIDGIVEGLAKSAHIVNDIIEKVEEAEDKLESLILSEANEEKVSKQVVEKEEVPILEPSAIELKIE
ncbi:hypothetical protein LXL04_039119 [Taraxacum kok-saghyz]